MSAFVVLAIYSTQAWSALSAPSPNNGDYTVSWTGPLFCQPSPAAGYVCRWLDQKVGAGAWTTVATTGTSISFTGKSPGTYKYRLARYIPGNAGTPVFYNQIEQITVMVETPASFSINDVSVAEGGNATFTVRRSGSTTSSQGVYYATATGSAGSSDFLAKTSTLLTFTSGQTTETVTVATTEDLTDESAERFYVNLSGATGGATISDSQGYANITDNDGPPGSSSQFSHSPTPTFGDYTVNWVDPLHCQASDAAGYACLFLDEKVGNGEWTRVATAGTSISFAGKAPGTYQYRLATYVAGPPPSAPVFHIQRASTTITVEAPPSFSINNKSVSEGGTLTFMVSRSGWIALPVSVHYTTATGTAGSGDFTARSGVVNLAANQTSMQVPVATTEDFIHEGTERLYVNLSNAAGVATISDSQGYGDITNDDPGAPPDSQISHTPTTTLGDYTLNWADPLHCESGLPLAPEFCLYLDEKVGAGNWTTIATAGTSISFTGKPPGTYQYRLATYGVDPSDPNPPLVLAHEAPITVTVESPPSFSISNASATEGGNVSFTVTRSGSTGGAFNVSYKTVTGGTAQSADYQATTGTPSISFADGQTTRPIVIAALPDSIYESAQTFNVQLTDVHNASGINDYATIGDAYGVGTINPDGDAAPVFSIDNNPSTAEGGTLSFTVKKTGASELSHNVSFATASGTAGSGDFTSRSGTLNLTTAQSLATAVSISVPVSTIEDLLAESNETLYLNLSLATHGATVSDGQGVGTITNDDVDGPPSFTSSPVTTGYSNVPYSYTATATDPNGTAVTFGLSVKPSGMTINANTGLIGWTSPEQGEHSVTVTVSDGANTTTQSYTLTISPPIPIFSNAINPTDDTPTGSNYKGALAGRFSVGKDGSANYAVAIEVPPGINQLQPSLSLSYNSNRGNGLVGWGWSLGGLSSIHRCRASLIRDNFVYGSLLDNYRYCLDGQRLVEVAPNEFRTENERYAKIVKSGAAGNGPEQWTVYLPNGNVVQYGFTADSRQAEQDRSDILAWHINRVTDKVGNYMTYGYDSNTATGRHRISQISYTLNAGQQGTNNTISFVYENRPDVLESYQTGAVHIEDKRLARIEVKTNGGMVRQYQLAYEQYNGTSIADPAKVSRLHSVQECFASLSDCTPANQFTWTSTAASTFSVNQENGIDLATRVKQYADMDGDGYLDRVKPLYDFDSQGYFISNHEVEITYGTELFPAESTVGAFFANWTASPTVPGITGDVPGLPYAARASSVMDVNGDGRTDIIVTDMQGLRGVMVYLSQPNRTFALSTDYSLDDSEVRGWIASQQYYYPYHLIYKDFNGDGLVDVLRASFLVHCSGCTVLTPHDELSDFSVALNTGSGFASFEEWANTGSNLDWRKWMKIADVNGDGLPDLIGLGGHVAINTGSFANGGFDFGPANTGVWGSVPGLHADETVDPRTGRYQYDPEVADVNGDGLADLVSVTTTGIKVYLSTGTAFAPGEFWYSGDVTNKGRFTVQDMNGDHKADVVFMGPPLNDPDADEGLYNLYALFSTGSSPSGTTGGFSDIVNLTSGSRTTDFRSKISDHVLYSGLGVYQDFNQDGVLDWFDTIDIKTHRLLTVSESDDKHIDIGYLPLAQHGLHYAALSPSSTVPTGDGGNGKPTHFISEATLLASGQNQIEYGTSIANDPLRNRYGVSRTESSNDIGGETVRTYLYGGAKRHRLWGGLGFERVQVTEQIPGSNQRLRSDTQYSQVATDAYRLSGAVLKQTRALVNDGGTVVQTLSEQTNQWRVVDLNDDIDGGNYDSPHNFPYLLESTAQAWDPAGTPIRRETHQTLPSSAGVPGACSTNTTPSVTSAAYYEGRFDDYGNPGNQAVMYCDGSSASAAVASGTARTYENRTGSPWIIGLVTSESVTRKLNDGTSQTRNKSFTYNASGYLNTQVLEPGNAALALTTTYGYDAYGYVSSAEDSWASQPNDGLGFSSRATAATTTYDGQGRKTVATTNQVGLSTTIQYNAPFGLPINSVDEDGLQTQWSYDAQGRVTLETRPDGTTTHTYYKACNDCFSHNGHASYFVHTKATGASPGRVYYDSFDREVGSRSTGLAGYAIYAYQSYDARGRLATQSAPFSVNDAQLVTQFSYDVLNRPTMTTYPDSTTSSVSYTGLTTTKTNALGQVQSEVRNAADQVVSVTDDLGTTITYRYHPFGNLRSTVIGGVTTTVAYDLRGRKTQLTDPDTGVTTYHYNALNLLAEQTDAMGQVTRYGYDPAGRQTGRIDNATAAGAAGRTQVWAYVPSGYDGAGQLYDVSGFDTAGAGYSEVYTYDPLGRLQYTTTTINSTSYQIEQHYDAYSRPLGITYPTGYIAGNAYNAFGYLTQVYNAFTSEVLWTASAADARGHITAFTLGNGVETTQSYDPVYGRIESIHAAKAGFVIEDQTYAFDVLGNLRERHDTRAGVDEYFCYDTLNRLVDNGLSSCSGTGSTHLTYDLHGNLLSKTGIGSYAYGAGNAGPHAVTQAGGNTYHYDANGNLTSVSGTTPRTVSYTPFGKPALITGGGHSVAVIYGPNQHRVRRIDNNSVATTYVGGLYEHVGERQRIYLHDFAVLETGTGGAGLTYLHRDHLGSIVAKSDTTATNDDHVEWLAYAAWGKRLDESWAGNELGPTDQPNATTRGFTGHEHLDPVGLIHMNGRVYDAAIGRFLSADPLVQAPFNTQSYNRYSYVFNNPLSFTDPSGFKCVRGEEGDCLDEIVVKAERLAGDEMIVTGERTCSTGAMCISGERLRDWGGLAPRENPATTRFDQIRDKVFWLWGGWEDFKDDFKCIWRCSLPGDGSLESVLAPLGPIGGEAGTAISGTKGLVGVVRGALAVRSVADAEEVVVPGKRTFSTADRAAGLERAKDAAGVPRCQYCGSELDSKAGRPNSYEADHTIPYSRGGPSTPENLTPSCRTCNRSKGSLTPEEWDGP